MKIINSIITTKESLIIIFLASAVIGVGISYNDLYLFHIMLSILAIKWFYQLKENRYKFNFHIFHGNYISFLIIMLCWYSLSIFWASDAILALKYVFYIFCGITIILNMVYFSDTIDKLDTLFKVLSVLFVLELMIALIESFTSFRMPISTYSPISSYFGKEEVDYFSYGDFSLYSNFNPPTGFHWNTNDLAIAMIIILPFFLCSQRLLVKLIGIITITTISVMTASRAVFLALILAFCLYLLVVKKKIGTLSLVWLITISLFLGMAQLRESENPRINEVANSFQALTLYLKGDIDIGGSLQWRRELVNNGLMGLYQSYGLGLGAGGSTANQEQIGAVAGRFTSMHNFWVELLVEGGIIFGILTIFWYGSIIYKLFIISKINFGNKLNYYSRSLLLSMIAFIPAAIAASSTIYFFPMWIMLGMAIAVISIHNKTTN